MIPAETLVALLPVMVMYSFAPSLLTGRSIPLPATSFPSRYPGVVSLLETALPLPKVNAEIAVS